MHVEVCTDKKQFDALKSEWNSLLTSSRQNSLFLTWEWISAWLAVHPDSHLTIVTVKDASGHLIAIAPLYTTTMELGGVLPYRTLRVLGDWHSGAEYPALICDETVAEQATAALLNYLQSGKMRWDLVWMPNCAAWKPYHTRFIEQLTQQAGIGFRERKREFSAVTLPDSYETYFESLPKSKRTQQKRHENKINKSGDIVIRDCCDAADVAAFINTLFDLHNKHWSTKGDAGAFERRPAFKQFCEQFIPMALQQGWLKFSALECDGSIRAIQLAYIYDNTFHVLQEGFDPDFAGGVGNVLRAHVIRNCIEHKIVDYDFLGGLSEHKLSWGAQARNGSDLLIWRRGLKTLPLALREIWPGGRFLKMQDD